MTIKGQPVKFGTITFEPQAGQQVSATASIANGEFKLPKDKGVSPGKYRWLLSAPEREGRGEPGAPDTGPPIKSLVAEKDNGKSFEVVAGQDNVLDINIP